MNKSIDMTYLTGGDDWFGPNLGGATIYTNVPTGYSRPARMSASSSKTSCST